MTYTRTRKGSKAHRGPSQAAQDRQAEVELAVTGINDETPDYGAFLARWGSRYGEANLARLWVQCPGATALHRFGTWHGTGRQVRKGEHAIWLRIPHNGFDPDKVTAENPDGRVFRGAPWMALFDYSQTQPADGFDDTAPADADPDLVAEVKRLRMAAARLHPDMTGADTAAAFMAAWARYEAAKARLAG